MSLMDYAKQELERIPKDEDGMQELMNKNILEMIEIFSNQEHSGFSASYAINMLERLLRFKPITPLTGEDDEWGKIGEEDGIVTYNNKRCGTVFKDVYPDGRIDCHDIEHNIISDNGGITFFTSRLSREPVTFPYYPPTKPKKIYIEYIDEEHDEYVDITNDKERIKLLRKKCEEKYKER